MYAFKHSYGVDRRPVYRAQLPQKSVPTAASEPDVTHELETKLKDGSFDSASEVVEEAVAPSPTDSDFNLKLTDTSMESIEETQFNSDSDDNPLRRLFGAFTSGELRVMTGMIAEEFSIRAVNPESKPSRLEISFRRALKQFVNFMPLAATAHKPPRPSGASKRWEEPSATPDSCTSSRVGSLCPSTVADTGSSGRSLKRARASASGSSSTSDSASGSSVEAEYTALFSSGAGGATGRADLAQSVAPTAAVRAAPCAAIAAALTAPSPTLAAALAAPSAAAAAAAAAADAKWQTVEDKFLLETWEYLVQNNVPRKWIVTEQAWNKRFPNKPLTNPQVRSRTRILLRREEQKAQEDEIKQEVNKRLDGIVKQELGPDPPAEAVPSEYIATEQ
jgi:Arc/MetJ-type ribon-helix-helix transcriptional regulator